MIGNSQPTFPNKRFVCQDCGRDLGTRYERLRGLKRPNVTILKDGTVLCERCENKRAESLEVWK